MNKIYCFSIVCLVALRRTIYPKRSLRISTSLFCRKVLEVYFQGAKTVHKIKKDIYFIIKQMILILLRKLTMQCISLLEGCNLNQPPKSFKNLPCCAFSLHPTSVCHYSVHFIFANKYNCL